MRDNEGCDVQKMGGEVVNHVIEKTFFINSDFPF